MDLAPLRSSRDFRLLYASGTVTAFGTQAADVALLVQAKQLTGSAFAVGLLGATELLPLVVFGLYGGVLADRLDRRVLIRWCEVGLAGCAVLLVLNVLAAHPRVWPLYAVAALMSALASLQRPSLEAAIPRVVAKDQLTAGAALLALSQNGTYIAGSALGGLLAAGPGPANVYVIEAACFAASFAMVWFLAPLPTLRGQAADGLAADGQGVGGQVRGLGGVIEGLRYARSRPDLLGSYLVDLAAMIFAYPNALFPFLAAAVHADWAIGLMFAAPSAGALAVSLAGRRLSRISRHGLAIAVSAGVWGVSVFALGFAADIEVVLSCLAVGGAADMISGIFRDTMWNQTIPDPLRGRLAGVELLSYSLGPSAGQLRGGVVAELGGARFSLWAGGLACVAAVGLLCLAMPRFVSYRAAPHAVAAATDKAPA
jgi:MFS family permease